MRHVVCPIYDHRGNKKIERLVRTINERLRANPEVLTEKQNKLFYELISALRTNKGKDGKSSFERHTGRKPNTVTSIIIKLYKEVNDLEFDRMVDLEKLEEFPRDDDSTIFVRNRQRKGKLAGLFKKRRGKITGETSHPIKLLPPERTNEIVLCKREVARGEKKTSKQKTQESQKLCDGRDRKGEETANGPGLRRLKRKRKKLQPRHCQRYPNGRGTGQKVQEGTRSIRSSCVHMRSVKTKINSLFETS